LSKRTLDRNKERSINLKLITIITACLLVTSIFTVIPVLSTQPPIDTSTYYVGTIGQPARMDPARAYDTASGELIQNVAQTLIWWNDKHPISFTPGVGYNLTLADYANLDSYTPVLATALPTITMNYTAGHLDTGEYYTFTVNTAATFQPWTAGNGSIIPSRHLTAYDVVYSFQRQMVYDSYYAPTWMWFGPAFTGAATAGLTTAVGGPFPCYSNGTFKHTADSAAATALIQGWVYAGPGPNDVSFHFQNPWAPGVLNQIFAQTWGSIVEPEWVMEHGGWNGQFPIGASDSNMATDWTNLWHWKPTVTRSEIDAWKDPAIYGAVGGSKFPSSAKHVNEIMGTGPYLFTAWDQTNKIWRIDAWNALNAIDHSSYWGGWSGSHVTTVIEKGVDSWPTRKVLFLEGEFDDCYVPRANMFDLLTTDAYHPAPGINLVYNIAQLSNDMIFFCMNVSAASSYQSYVGYPHQTAAEPLFFANEHIRRAFAWALNYTQYISQAYFGEGLQQASWWVDGLSPASYKNTALTLRNLDYTQMQNELNQAIVDGFNVSQYGFETTLVYDIGNDQRMIAMQLIASAFQSLNGKYKCNVIGLDWPVFLDAMNSMGMPVFCSGWSADFADPHDFAQPYMQSTGNFPISQGPPFPADQATIDAEINAAVIEPNFTQRGIDYRDLQQRFYDDVITLPLVQPVGRRFARDWVQGWYYNALFPGLYAYDIYKSVVATQNVDIKVVSIVPTTPLDPIVALRFRPSWVFNVTLMRENDASGITNLWVAVALKLTNQSNLYYCYPNGTYCVLAPGMSMSVELTWDKSYPITRGNWSISAEAYPMNSNAVDNDLSDQTISDGMVQLVGYGKGELSYIPEDLNQDGIVSVFPDAILLANYFGTTGPPGWIQQDLMPDGVVDMFDFWMLDRRIGWTFDHPTNPTAEPWSLSVHYSQTNFTVEVYSNYIVYSKYSFDINLKQLEFNVTTDVDAFCNVTIPKVLMSGNFTVYLDDVPKSVTVTENATHYSLYFESAELSHKVKVTSTQAGLLGDVNGDGWVDIYDAIILAGAYNSVPGSPTWNPNADINNDGIVDIYDAIILANHYGQHYP